MLYGTMELFEMFFVEQSFLGGQSVKARDGLHTRTFGYSRSLTLGIRAILKSTFIRSPSFRRQVNKTWEGPGICGGFIVVLIPSHLLS